MNRKLPAVKKASEFVNQKSHIQKKYISLMIVPSYSGSKTRSLHIPHAVFYGTILMFFMISAIIAGLYIRNLHFEQMTHSLSYTLEETIDEFEEFVQTAEETHIYLRDNSLQIYAQLNNEQNRAREEQDLQEQTHQSNFDVVQMYIDIMEQQIRDFEEERLEILEFLSSRGEKIPPIAGTLRQMETSQQNLYEYLQIETTPAPEQGIRLLGAGIPAPLTEEELLTQLTTLSEELNKQRQLFESIQSYKSRMEPYLSNFPTLMPIKGGRITSWFGSRRDPITGRTAFHEGVDIPAPSGTPIHAAGGGTVSYSGWRGGYGNVVFIDHGNGLQTRYAHNTRNLVTVGQRVERGEVIAYVGSTGRSISPHLHYEVLRNGSQINPVPFITETLD
ncbi:MAG: M23 family metallopeptidase [Defluviitaleaceae bacterium]|nr:M23 family metallopeptidase [Defluviitaleaceae bacterium]